jgi:hypothetical protein
VIEHGSEGSFELPPRVDRAALGWQIALRGWSKRYRATPVPGLSSSEGFIGPRAPSMTVAG